MNAIERLERDIESVEEYGGIVNQYPEWGERLVSIRISDAGAWLELVYRIRNIPELSMKYPRLATALRRLQENTP